MVEDLNSLFKEKLTDPRIASIREGIIGPNIEFLSV